MNYVCFTWRAALVIHLARLAENDIVLRPFAACVCVKIAFGVLSRLPSLCCAKCAHCGPIEIGSFEQLHGEFVESPRKRFGAVINATHSHLQCQLRRITLQRLENIFATSPNVFVFIKWLNVCFGYRMRDVKWAVLISPRKWHEISLLQQKRGETLIFLKSEPVAKSFQHSVFHAFRKNIYTK